ncbi:MAG: 16S rRNA (cytosine(1402)-N(4))-methyltransferase RsmH [Acidobacteriaceae bacterium]
MKRKHAIKRTGAGTGTKSKESEISQSGEQGQAENEVSSEGAELGHVSVLLQPAIYFLNIDRDNEARRGGTYVDATLGLGGHSAAIAQRLGAAGRLICFDRDEQALRIAGERLAALKSRLGAEAPRVELVHGRFSQVGEHVAPGTLDGLLADFGVNSIQLDDAARGFSFRAEGPLDMRMDQAQSGRSADQVVNHLDEPTLADVIYEFGEERRSRRIARAIVRARPIRNTAHLAEVVSAAVPAMYAKHKPGQKRIHHATKTFQGIRMFVNRELEEVEALLSQAPALLRRGGRLVAISFHSLEDRRVKDHMREMAQQGAYELLTRKPVVADEQEMERNPRSRSAKLRAAERI